MFELDTTVPTYRHAASSTHRIPCGFRSWDGTRVLRPGAPEACRPAKGRLHWSQQPFPTKITLSAILFFRLGGEESYE